MNDAIFVDIDNTLVDVRAWDCSKAYESFLANGGSLAGFEHGQVATIQGICTPDDKAFMFDGGDIFISRLRPGAKEFLAKLRNMTPKLYCLTYGFRVFQTNVMKQHGILDLFDGLYGRESINELDKKRIVPVHQNPLLIDDQPPLSFLAIAKLDVMRVIDGDSQEALEKAFDKHYVQIDAFWSDPDDAGFAKIEQRLALMHEKQE